MFCGSNYYDSMRTLTCALSKRQVFVFVPSSFVDFYRSSKLFCVMLGRIHRMALGVEAYSQDDLGCWGVFTGWLRVLGRIHGMALGPSVTLILLKKVYFLSITKDFKLSVFALTQILYSSISIVLSHPKTIFLNTPIG